jgi:hypothetical protein
MDVSEQLNLHKLHTKTINESLPIIRHESPIFICFSALKSLTLIKSSSRCSESSQLQGRFKQINSSIHLIKQLEMVWSGHFK